MDSKKQEKIKDFLLVWGYKPEQILEYIRQTAPNIGTDGQRARHEQTRAFFDKVLKREHVPKQGTAIPKPENLDAKGIAYDLWLLLGMGENAITLEDLSDYSNERLARIDSEKKQQEKADNMSMANMLRNMNQDEYQKEHEWFAASFANSERLRNQKTDMNQFLQDLPNGCDSTPLPINLGNVGVNPFNDQLRGLNPDNRA